jgi:hypothetical protein
MRSIVRWIEFSSLGRGTSSSVQGGPPVDPRPQEVSNGRSANIAAIRFLLRAVVFPPAADD